MDMVNVLFLKLGHEQFKPLLVIGKDLVFQFPIDEECHIKLPFRNIDTEYRL
jgi:hypothetical protein